MAKVLRPTLVSGTAEPVAGIVRAGADGAEWALPGGASVFASAGSELRVLGVPQSLRLSDKRAVNGYTVVLKSGLARLRVPDGSSSALVLSAPKKTSVIVASGEAVVSAKDQVAVGNVSGSTQVALAGQRFRSLKPGTLQLADSGTRRALPGAPAALRGNGVVISYGESVALGGFDWEPVPGVAAYRVELRDAATNAVRASSETTEPRLPSGFANLTPGAYSLSVVSLDGTGLEGGRAPERALRVMRVALPTGGYVDAGGTVYLPRGSRLGLGEASGVEMTYGTSNHFVPVPVSLELFREEPRQIRFRIAGTQESSSLSLIPRQAQARVDFGANAHSWPQKPLEIRVSVQGARDVAGNPLPVRPRVTVGVEPVSVMFMRDGDTLRGLLPARTGSGPWVVRVEVEDQHGIALGRNFLEVAAR